MNFAAPLNLLWLIPAWGAITALYLLRRPRRNVDVASTVFWRSVPQESVRRSKVQKFTPQLLWIIQMLAALLLVLGLMQPQIRMHIADGTPIALVIDNGITSSATDIQGGRLSAEKKAALRILADPQLAHSKFTLISTAPVSIVGGLGVGVNEAKNLVDGVESTDEQSDIPSAVSAASSSLSTLTKFGQSPQIMLLSDLAWDNKLDPEVENDAGRYDISADRQGAVFGTSNVSDAAITHFAVQRSNVDPNGTLDVFVQVSSTNAIHGAQITLSADGVQTISRTLDLTPGSPESVSLQLHAPKTSEVITARLGVPEGFDDQLSDDNTAYATLPASGGSHVLLVTDGDPALSRALTLLPGVSITQVNPTDYAANGAAGQFDATIFDGVMPNPHKAVSGGEMIWGGRDNSFQQVSSDAIQQNVVDWSRSNPVLRFTDLSSTSLSTAAWTRVGNWSPIIESQNGIVAASTDLGGQRKVWMSFEPTGSGFDVSPAFPIFVSNAITWLCESSSGDNAAAGIAIQLPHTKPGWTVSGPGISQSGLCSDDNSLCSFSQTNRAGIYTATSGDQTIRFVRNCPSMSIDLTPKDHPFLPGSPRQAASAKSTTQLNWQSAIGFVVALCLVFLIGEWIFYHKPLQKQKA